MLFSTIFAGATYKHNMRLHPFNAEINSLQFMPHLQASHTKSTLYNHYHQHSNQIADRTLALEH